MVISPSMRSRLLDINLVANQNMGFTLPTCRWGGGQGTGARENRRWEGYRRREKNRWEAGSLRWREAGEKFKMASFLYLLLLIHQVKEMNPSTFLDFHLTFSEA